MSTSQGVKILGKDLEKALAGLPLLVAHKDDEVPVLRVTHTHTNPVSSVKADCLDSGTPSGLTGSGVFRTSWCVSSNRR